MNVQKVTDNGKAKAGSGSAAEGGRRPNGAGEPEPARKRKRFWAQHKVEAVLRLLPTCLNGKKFSSLMELKGSRNVQAKTILKTDA